MKQTSRIVRVLKNVEDNDSYPQNLNISTDNVDDGDSEVSDSSTNNSNRNTSDNDNNDSDNKNEEKYADLKPTFNDSNEDKISTGGGDSSRSSLSSTSWSRNEDSEFLPYRKKSGQPSNSSDRQGKNTKPIISQERDIIHITEEKNKTANEKDDTASDSSGEQKTLEGESQRKRKRTKSSSFDKEGGFLHDR